MPPRRRRLTSTKKQPFSLILEPSELKALRRLAKAQNTSVASLVRGAISATLMTSDPSYGRRVIGQDVDRFLDRVADRLPAVRVDNSLRRKFKRLVAAQVKL